MHAQTLSTAFKRGCPHCVFNVLATPPSPPPATAEDADSLMKNLVWNPVSKTYVPASHIGSETQSEAWRD